MKANNTTVQQPLGAMRVRSVRLPGGLWQRLETLCDEVNRQRLDALQKQGYKQDPTPVTLSSVLRGLLEQGLAAGKPIDFEAAVVRPPRVYRERAEKLARTRAVDEGPSVFETCRQLCDRHAITPPAFHKAIGGDRVAAQEFYVRGKLPKEYPHEFLRKVKIWNASMENP
jgi:hypothetical protein